jgi:TonB family protein
MGALPKPEMAAFRYASYLEELREFFADNRLQYGAPSDIFAITERLQASESFAADLSSMVRSIILREGGSMPHAQLLEILAHAIGGPEMERAPQHYRQPLRQLLSFVTGVLRRPWDLPPGDPMPAELAAPVVAPLPEQPAPEPELDHAPHAQHRPAAAFWIPAPVDARIRPARGSPSLRNILVGGSGATLIAVLIALALHPHSPDPAKSQPTLPPAPISNPTSTRADANVQPNLSLPAPQAIPAAEPIPDGNAISNAKPIAPQPAPVHRSHTAAADADYAVPPSYRSFVVNPNPRQPSTSSSQPVAAASSSTPSADSATTPGTRPPTVGQTDAASPPEHQLSYRDPDASIVGDPLPIRPTARPFTAQPPVKVSSGIMASNLISAPNPDYPLIARLAHVQGQVILQAVIARDGSVSATHVLRGHRLLRSAAQDAVRRWHYRPYRLDGHPVDITTIVTVDFHPKPNE